MSKELKKVGRDSDLHEKAVQAIAEGSVQPMPRRRSSGPSRAPRVLNSHHIRVIPMVWKAAKEIVADKANTYTTIDIRSEAEVVVR